MDELQKEINKLMKELLEIDGIPLDLRYKEVKRQEYVKFIEDSTDVTNADMYTMEELKYAIEEASTRSLSDSRGSPSFYEHLEDILLNEI